MGNSVQEGLARLGVLLGVTDMAATQPGSNGEICTGKEACLELWELSISQTEGCTEFFNIFVPQPGIDDRLIV